MTEKTAAGSPAEAEGGFDALLADLDLLAKAMPAAGEDNDGADGEDDDAKIQAAAEDGAAQGDGADGKAEGSEDGAKGDDEEEGTPFGKSFEVTLADGRKERALDGTAMLKALHDENLALRAQGSQLTRGVSSLGELVKSLVVQRTEDRKLLKSMSAQLARLGDQGRGRKALLHVNEKPSPAAPAAPEAPPAKETIMAKAQSLRESGALTGAQVIQVFSYTERGLGVPDELQHLFAS